MYRPGGQDAADPQFAAALEFARQDAELGEWLARQRAFDELMSQSLKAVAVPARLRASLLAQAPALRVAAPSRRAPWQQAVAAFFNTPIIPEKRILNSPWWGRWSVRAAAAMCALLLVAVPVALSSLQPQVFTRYLNDIVAASWDDTRHLELRTNDLATVRQWLQTQQVDSTFAVPPALQTATLHGASVLNWNGRKVAFLCYLDGLQHLHFLVSDLADAPDAPSPEMLKVTESNHWTTYSWVENQTAYVLTGLRMQEFLKRFRKDGQWQFKARKPASLDEQSWFAGRAGDDGLAAHAPGCPARFQRSSATTCCGSRVGG